MRVILCGADSDTLLFDSDIHKTEIRIQKAIREARVLQIVAAVPLLDLSDFSYDEEMGDVERITLGDYMRLNNLDEVT